MVFRCLDAFESDAVGDLGVGRLSCGVGATGSGLPGVRWRERKPSMVKGLVRFGASDSILREGSPSFGFALREGRPSFGFALREGSPSFGFALREGNANVSGKSKVGVVFGLVCVGLALASLNTSASASSSSEKLNSILSKRELFSDRESV